MGNKVKKLERHLNIITLNIPYPPDHGGMIDSYYRIKSLHGLGIKIHLHCFTYGRSPSAELDSLCESVDYYPRNSSIFRQLSYLPFIVNSRISAKLFENIAANSFPILFDGLHTTYLLDHPAFSDRKKFVRLHNIEHNYYLSMARHERSPLKKLFFRLESSRLKRFEKILRKATELFPISYPDYKYFSNKYGKSLCIEPFHPFDNIMILPGNGEYILYHGDLSVNENEDIVRMLVNEVFSKLEYRCIVAGRNPSQRTKELVSRYHNVKLIPDPDKSKMMELVKNAHIHIIPSAGEDGFKLKLLSALMAGRYIVANKITLRGSGDIETIIVAETPAEMIAAIEKLMKTPFTDDMISLRRRIFAARFDNVTNSSKMSEAIFTEAD